MRPCRQALLTLALLLTAPHAWAWGREGHRLTALVAEAYLTPAAKEEVHVLLGRESLADISSWADDYRESHPETAPWHFDDIPAADATYDRDRDCPRNPDPASPWRDCVTDRVLYFKTRLADTALPQAERAEALKFLVHFVGDLHQPLHTVGDARGGNNIHVRTLGPPCGNGNGCNLHAFWDTDLVEDRGLSETRHLDLLLREINANHWQHFAAGNPVSWTNQSHQLAQRALVSNGVLLPAGYVTEETEVADAQLAVGGLRLAALLNLALAPPPSDQSNPNRVPLPLPSR